MEAHLLNPKVRVQRLEYRTQQQLNRILKAVKSKKFGAKIYAVDVEEVTLDAPLTIDSVFKVMRSPMRMTLKPGNYFHIHLEYVL